MSMSVKKTYKLSLLISDHVNGNDRRIHHYRLISTAFSPALLIISCIIWRNIGLLGLCSTRTGDKVVLNLYRSCFHRGFRNLKGQDIMNGRTVKNI